MTPGQLDLDAIENDVATMQPYARIEVAGRFYPGYYADDEDVKRVVSAVPELVAEVRRLRAALVAHNERAAR